MGKREVVIHNCGECGEPIFIYYIYNGMSTGEMVQCKCVEINRRNESIDKILNNE